MNDPNAPKVIAEGFHLAFNTDRSIARQVPVGDEPGTGWHIASEAEFDAHIKAVGADAFADTMTEIGHAQPGVIPT
jgi:hypothetical protein